MNKDSNKNIIKGLKKSDYHGLLSALNQTALVSITDVKGRITYANDKFAEVSKYSRDELEGQNHRILKSGHQSDKLFIDLWKTISHGQVWRGVIKNKAKDGSFYWVDTSIAPILDEKNKPIKYVAVRFPISDRKLAEEKLEERNKLLEQNKLKMNKILKDIVKEKETQTETIAKDEAILQSIGDALVATDAKGKVLLVNSEFENLTGLKNKEIHNKYLKDVLELTDSEGIPIKDKDRPITHALNNRKTTITGFTEGYSYKHRNGKRFPVSITITPVIIGKRFVGTVEVFRDITKDREIDRAKSEFVSLASHQLRTPLTAMKWYSDMLVAGDAGKLTEEQEKYLAEIQTGTSRMVDLVNALLNVSRIELGTFMIEPEEVNVISLCKDIVRDNEPKIFQRKQEFKESYDKNIPNIKLDTKLMRIVIENLVSNAVKYTPEKGTISLSVKKIKSNLLIIVKDSGYGIPENQQGDVFGKLFRADNVKAYETEGTGLGLYIAKSVIEAAGGKIWFESKENKGSSFFIELPLSGMKQRRGSRQLD